MHLNYTLHRISTNVRFVTGSLLLPEYAAALAERLFLTPPRPHLPQSSFFDFLDARSSYVEYRGRSLATWRWGPLDAPAVLLAHGFGGYAAQMRGFVPRLLAEGLRVVAYDQPAHGLSEGGLTGLPDFAGALAAVASHHGGKRGGNVQHVIAHSLGGVAAAIAVSRGLTLRSMVLVSPPSDLVGYSRQFARWYWMPEPLRRAMQAAIEERFGVRWVELEVSRLAPRLHTPALVIHDRNDRVVPWSQGATLARAWPGARLLSTDGLGHGRILESDVTLSAAADFITGKSAVASLATPELPHPAPLY
jgi:pimeloyl-ACP methyl ester carboxylesterase